MKTVTKRKLLKFFEILTAIVGVILIAVGIYYFTVEPFIGLFAFILIGVIMLMVSLLLRGRGRSLT